MAACYRLPAGLYAPAQCQPTPPAAPQLCCLKVQERKQVQDSRYAARQQEGHPPTCGDVKVQAALHRGHHGVQAAARQQRRCLCTRSSVVLQQMGVAGGCGRCVAQMGMAGGCSRWAWQKAQVKQLRRAGVPE